MHFRLKVHASLYYICIPPPIERAVKEHGLIFAGPGGASKHNFWTAEAYTQVGNQHWYIYAGRLLFV
jgi:hypothetical protein